MKPSPADHPPYFSYFIGLVEQDTIVDALTAGKKSISEFIKNIPANKSEYAYADKKWTVKQVLNHIIDTERILSYRALCFSRGEKQILPAFDENLYVANANLQNTDLNLLLQEFEAVRESTVLLFNQLSDKELAIKGATKAGEVSVLSVGFMICGHGLHHANIIRERYLS